MRMTPQRALMAQQLKTRIMSRVPRGWVVTGPVIWTQGGIAYQVSVPEVAGILVPRMLTFATKELMGAPTLTPGSMRPLMRSWPTGRPNER